MLAFLSGDLTIGSRVCVLVTITPLLVNLIVRVVR